MRDIKFRAWDKVDEKMRKVREIGFDQYGGAMYVILTIPFPTNNGDVDFDFVKRNPEEFILLRYTGLTDKNGKEIYEGDIVKGLVMFQNNLMEVKGVVKFIHGRFVIAEYNCSLYEFANIPTKKSNEIVVIGNKYENPELLGGE